MLVGFEELESITFWGLEINWCGLDMFVRLKIN
jgi:hypothetical protein